MRATWKKQAGDRSLYENFYVFFSLLWIAATAAACLQGCAIPSKPDAGVIAMEWGPGTILSAHTRAPVSFVELLDDLLTVRLVYVGEKHTSGSHHEVQLRIIQALDERDPRLAVGMEMFDRPYQAVLDRWTAGALDEDEFLRSTHWYANWRFDYALYRDILDYVKSRGIRLLALNLPFSIPPKIRVGGTAHLLDYEKEFLPREVDTSVAAHREFVQAIFSRHDFKGNVRFEDFYLAQCVWEEVMAEALANHLGEDRMVVLAGNGHIQFAYGIPQRAFKRTGTPYRTIYLKTTDEELDLTIADYVWITD
jgi:uncharacterized iron-regulated protein